MVLAPIVRDRKGEYHKVFEDARKAGFVRVRVDGQVRDLDEQITLDRYKMHSIDVVVDRVIIEEQPEHDSARSRLTDSVETALRLGSGILVVQLLEDKAKGQAEEERTYSEHFACVDCGLSFGELEPRNFSFNSPHGACRECTGLGVRMELDPGLVIQNKNLSLAEGAILPWARTATVSTWYMRMLDAVGRKHHFSTQTPVKNLTPEQLNVVLYGDKGGITIHYQSGSGNSNRWDTTFEGVIPNLERRYRETDSEYVKGEIERYMAENPCPACGGASLMPESLAVNVDGHSISAVSHYSIDAALEWITRLQAPDTPLSGRE